MPYYHVRIIEKSNRTHIRLDFTDDELENRILAPYRKGSAIVIGGKSIPVNDIDRIRINQTEIKSENIRPDVEQRRSSSGMAQMRSVEWEIAAIGTEVTDQFITSPPGTEINAVPAALPEPRPAIDSREVFVVHGRNDGARDALFTFLRSIGLNPLEWARAVQATGKPTPYIGEILDAAFSNAHAVVVLFTPDDEARLTKALQSSNDPPHETQLTGQARPNVLFEAGMAMARHQNRTILIELGHLRPFSDIAGLLTVRLNNTTPSRQQLAQRLKSAGCPVNLDGTDWHTVGDFDGTVTSPQPETGDSTPVENVKPPTAPSAHLSDDARTLLVEAATDGVGIISRIQTIEGLIIQTSGRHFAEQGNARSEARWDYALKEILLQGFIEGMGGKGQTFRVTHEGFQAADDLQSSN